ncbi:LysR family transcriptional regulator [Bacillus sp. M6-12]|uniref:LysR family transcriptional regulator n=1 Tax=Bacillus sp. M6-12 TaxID=2054166 RepID=UPI0015E0FA23|nr:LysR family transcriptional regulator [Bacillus sp. M6-12]
MVQLKYFITIVETGSITHAAKNLFISQPALSKQLSLLEKDLNCELFQRKTTGLELTEAGKFFYENAAELIQAAENLSSHMATYSQKSTIRIGALPSIGSYFLPNVINKIGTAYKVELTIKETTQELINLLESNFIDFAFAQDTIKNPRNVYVKNLFWEPYDAIVPVSDRTPLTITLKEFLKKNLILHKNPCDIRMYFESYCRDRNLSFTVSIDLESNETIIPFVTSGVGSSILPRMASRHVNNSSTNVLILEEEKLKRSVDFLYKPLQKKLAKELIAFAEESIQENM